MNIKFSTLICSCFLFFNLPLIAQESYTGATADNYLGSTSNHFQPANIVDSKYKYQLSFSTNFASTNNFNALNFNNLIGFTKHPRNEYRDHRRGGFAAFNFNVDLVNAMIEYKHKNAFGYHLSLKSFRMNSGIPGELTFADFNNFNDNPTTPFDYQNLRMQSFTYLEHGFHYGRIIREGDEHFLKAGVTGKLINGLDASYFYSQSGSMNFTGTTGPGVELNPNGTVEYGRMRSDVSASDHKLGVGLDLGAVYEYRPEYDSYKYNMDGKKNIERYDVNKYLYKVGVSITNLGGVKFLKDSTTYDYNANNTNISGTSFLDLNNNGFNNVDGTLTQPSTTKATSDKDNFRMGLPTALNLQFDYNIYKNFYAAYAGSIPLGIPSDPNSVKYNTMHSIVPRYETQNIGVSVPLSIKGNGQFMVGTHVRLSKDNLSIFAGSHNLTYLFGKRKIYDASIFAGLAIGLPHKIPSDRDFDEVSDKMDRCPDDPGLWKYKGCPDTDNDGIIDLEDHCIYDQGEAKNNGCPDRDNDGVIDVNDRCPDDAGLAVHYGCPDRDKDGVIDAADRCPDVPGIEFNNGCPFENPGCCTDNDGDGISNELDECPEVSGSIYNNGCPVDSTNLNTININEQKEEVDPNHTGEQVKDNPIENTDAKEDNTIPVQIDHNTNENDLVQGKELARLVVNFESDQSYLEQQYIKKIDELLEETKATKKDNIEFVVIGHTDADGSDNYNLILSRKRAETVRKHLSNKGIDYDKIKTYYYGEWEPLNSDNNEETKQLNRRVEIIIIKK